MNKAPIALALDTSDLQQAIAWVKATDGLVSLYKLGLEFYLNFGSAGIRAVSEATDTDIFLDLKLHDIPHTVAGAARAVASLAPKYLTVHASGGHEMIKAAVAALPETLVTGVTILTSLSEEDVSAIGFKSNALESATELATLAVAAGARAIVCSPLEILSVRARIGNSVTIITPGVRPLDSLKTDDQVRTLTPAQAIERGADLVVIGRPITSMWPLGATAMRERTLQIGSEIF